jgi:hypothetical protein
MVLDFVESRVTNPVKLVDWGSVDDGHAVLCPCCGWRGHLGDCAQTSTMETRTYACDRCEMILVARVAPNVFSLSVPAAPKEWWEHDRLNSAVA